MLEDAIKSFRLAIQAQREYIQLGHICYWCVNPLYAREARG